MILTFQKNNKLYYELVIRYHYLVGSEKNWIQFSDSAKFQAYMEECHPGISCDKVREIFTKKYDELVALAAGTEYDNSKKSTTLHCCLCGDELFVTTYETGIVEKIYAYKEASDKANEGYIKTVLAHNWSFKQENGIMVVRYWYDPENTNAMVYKIHIFCNKVILGRDGSKPASIIVTDKFYVHYEGEKKPE
jgi:hypothetical protein